MQRIAFHPRHFAAVSSGTKTSTVRWAEPVRPGPVRFDFGEAGCIDATVLSVKRYPAVTLTPEQAMAPAGEDMAEFVRALRANYYPNMPDDAELDVLTFRLGWGG